MTKPNNAEKLGVYYQKSNYFDYFFTFDLSTVSSTIFNYR